MPEGPEVHVMAQDLARLVGRKLTTVTSHHAKYDNLIPQITSYGDTFLINIRPNGKVLFLAFGANRDDSSSVYTIIFHFGLTGHLSYSRQNSTRFFMQFDDIGVVYADSMNIGSIKCASYADAVLEYNKLGPCVLEPREFTITKFISAVRRSNKMICALLIDQTIVCGIGNYLRSDILYYANIAPMRIASDLQDAEIGRLYECAIRVAANSYASGGTSVRNYSMNGQAGRYNPVMYKNTVDPNGENIAVFAAGSQKIYWVPANIYGRVPSNV